MSLAQYARPRAKGHLVIALRETLDEMMERAKDEVLEAARMERWDDLFAITLQFRDDDFDFHRP